jgi:ABC transport system ATP-binding/permease protein
MSSGPNNLVNLEKVTKSYGIRILLDEVSLGVGAGERIGIVGRNGDGKTTLLNLIAGREEPDAGRVSRSRGLHLGYLDQRDLLDDTHTVREVVLGGKADHEWAADSTTREVVEVLLAGVALDREVHGLSGGERRRCSLAKLLLEPDDLLILDEPTNHLDVEAVAWLAEHLKRRSSALVVVTHDRWFLDEVCQTTWEVHPGSNGAGEVDIYDGGYAAFVLAKAERQRQAASSESRRQNLMRKELAWLRRGAPARTSKPKFRIDAANDLIADEPPPRDRLALERFSVQRLGKDVVDLEDVDLVRGERTLLKHATWRLGPGDRVGIVGVNGAGKTSVLNLVAGNLAPTVGKVKHGRTIALAHLTQDVTPEDPQARVLGSVEEIRRVTRTASGQDVSATAMLERFGFTGDRLTARLGDLSGGERRRFQLLKLLLGEPNVLLLDEPTNDLDIETLNVLEDYLDGWPGTLIVVSHDRYFLERVTDSVWALLGDGSIGMLPGGVDQYLEMRKAADAPVKGIAAPPHSAPKPAQESAQESTPRGGEGAAPVPGAGAGPGKPAKAKIGGAEERAARKTVARIDNKLQRLITRETDLNAAMASSSDNYEEMGRIAEELRSIAAEKDELELEWLEAAALLE